MGVGRVAEHLLLDFTSRLVVQRVDFLFERLKIQVAKLHAAFDSVAARQAKRLGHFIIVWLRPEHMRVDIYSIRAFGFGRCDHVGVSPN